MLRPGGSLLLSTPYLAAWSNRGLLAFVFSRSSQGHPAISVGRPAARSRGPAHLHRRALVAFLGGSGLDWSRSRAPATTMCRPYCPARPDLLPLAGGARSCWSRPASVMLRKLAPASTAADLAAASRLQRADRDRPSDPLAGPSPAAVVAGPDRAGTRAPGPGSGAPAAVSSSASTWSSSPHRRSGSRTSAWAAGRRGRYRAVWSSPWPPRSCRRNFFRNFILLTIFVLACAGAAALLGARWPERIARPRPPRSRSWRRVCTLESGRRGAADHGPVGGAARLRRPSMVVRELCAGRAGSARGLAPRWSPPRWAGSPRSR